MYAVRAEGTCELREEAPVCPICGTRDVKGWPPGRAGAPVDEDEPPLRPCPCCGTEMSDDGTRGLWD